MKKLSCLLLINLLACSVARARNVGIGTNSYITIQSLKGVSTNGLSVFDMRFTAFLFLDGLSWKPSVIAQFVTRIRQSTPLGIA